MANFKLTQALRLNHNRALHTEPGEFGINDPENGTTNMIAGGALDSTTTGDDTAILPGLQGIIPDENDNPLKQRIPDRRRKRRWRRTVAWMIAHSPWRPLTAEEAAAQAEAERRRKMEKTLRDESSIAMRLIVNALNRRELCYRYRKSERDWYTSGVQSVKFNTVVLQPDAIYMRVDTGKLPRGVGILQLVDPDILTDLSLSVGRRVSAEYTEKIGCWYIIERATGVRGIPSHVKFADMVVSFPKTADDMTVPLGVTVNGKKIYRSIKTMPHLLIAGATDSGKSNMVNNVIGTLVMRNSPDTLRMIMVDLKGGMEFTFYEGLPHLMPVPGVTDEGIVYEREQVSAMLDWLIKFGEKRMELIKSAGRKNIDGYNKNRRKKRLSRLLLVIDEWADVRLARGIGAQAEERLANIAQRMRAVGIHIILATQVPKREVISTIIKTNLPGRMAFSCPSNTASQLIIDVGDARGLTPRGRFMYQKGTELLQIQAPYMSDKQIADIVSAAISGSGEPQLERIDVTQDEIIEYALDQLNGYLASVKLFEKFKGRIPKAELLDLLKSLDDTTIEARGNLYRVEPGAGSRSRQLVSVNPNPENIGQDQQ